jgi:Leucine-rich repeat (LRR) protein
MKRNTVSDLTIDKVDELEQLTCRALEFRRLKKLRIKDKSISSIPLAIFRVSSLQILEIEQTSVQELP